MIPEVVSSDQLYKLLEVASDIMVQSDESYCEYFLST